MTTTIEAPQRLLPTPSLPARLHNKVWQKCGWQPHPLQRQVLLSRRRNRLLSAGRRAGKSQVGGYALAVEPFRVLAELDDLRKRNLRREYWIVGPEYSDAEKEFRVVWNALSRLGFEFDRPGSYNNPESGEMQISMFDRRFIISAKSAKYPGTLVGEGLSGIVFSEAAKLKPSVYNKFLRPTLADFGGWTLFGSTPEGRNWFYDFWSIGQDAARKDWESWRAPSWSNPHVYPIGCNENLLGRLIDASRESQQALLALTATLPLLDTEMGLVPVGIDPEIYSLFLDMSIEMFNQEVQALFTEFVGRVFKDFDEEVHVVDQELRADWRTYAAVDYGFQNPFVWLLIQVDPHSERVHVVDEYYERGRTTREAAAEIRERGLAPNVGSFRVIEFFPDPSEPDRTRDLGAELEINAGGGTATEINDRLEWIRRFLKPIRPWTVPDHPENVPGLTVNRRCHNTIRELNVYRYKETAEQATAKERTAPENPLKKDDHTPEALGRFFSGLYGNPWDDKAGTRITPVRVGRQLAQHNRHTHWRNYASR